MPFRFFFSFVSFCLIFVLLCISFIFRPATFDSIPKVRYVTYTNTPLIELCTTVGLNYSKSSCGDCIMFEFNFLECPTLLSIMVVFNENENNNENSQNADKCRHVYRVRTGLKIYRTLEKSLKIKFAFKVLEITQRL